MKVACINLRGVNMEEALVFYRDLLGFKVELITEEKIVFGSRKDTKIVIIKEDGNKKQSNLEMQIEIEVKSFDGIIKNPEKYSIKLLSGPTAIYEEYRYVEIQDPNGYNLKLLEII